MFEYSNFKYSDDGKTHNDRKSDWQKTKPSVILNNR